MTPKAKEVVKNETKPETGVAVRGPSSAMLALFAPNQGVTAKLEKMTRLNLPGLVKPDVIPIGGILSAIIVKAVKSPVSTIKGCVLWLHLVKVDGDTITKTGTEITFPCTGVIRNALLPGVDGEKEVIAGINEFAGCLFVAKRTEDKPSKFKNAMFMFECFRSEKPVKTIEPALDTTATAQ